MADDALNAKRMNKNPGGKQPKMRRTKYVRDGREHIQDMVDSGKAKEGFIRARADRRKQQTVERGYGEIDRSTT
jgi:hypothetical protein